MSTKKTLKLFTIGTLAGTLALGAGAITEKIFAHEDEGEASQEKAVDEGIDIKKLSETFGNFIGRNLNIPGGVHFDLESIIKGMREGAAGKPAPLNDQEYELMMAKLQENVFKQVSKENLKVAEDFLKQNAHTKGIIEIVPEKLQYMIIEEGHDPIVGEHQSPLIHYTGKYLDGTVFGSSEDVGGPITIPLDQTIPGFSQGILNMKEGEKRRLFVHPDLGYGTSGQLPPNSLLIFDVKVIKADNNQKPDLETQPEEDGNLEGEEEMEDD